MPSASRRTCRAGRSIASVRAVETISTSRAGRPLNTLRPLSTLIPCSTRRSLNTLDTLRTRGASRTCGTLCARCSGRTHSAGGAGRPLGSRGTYPACCTSSADCSCGTIRPSLRPESEIGRIK